MSGPPPSYEEAQGMMTGPSQPPYPPQTQPYQGPKIDGYSGNPPYPTQPGQPGPYPTQQGYTQQSYPYQQPTVPPQGAYPPGTYVHPTVGYSPAQGVVVQNQGPVGDFVPAPPPAELQRAARQRRIVVFLCVFICIIAVLGFWYLFR